MLGQELAVGQVQVEQWVVGHQVPQAAPPFGAGLRLAELLGEIDAVLDGTSRHTITHLELEQSGGV